MDTVPDLTTLDREDGRLRVVDTQLDLINKILVDLQFDVIVDNEGNVLTE